MKWRKCTVPLTQLLAKLKPFYHEELGIFDEPDDDDLEINDEDWRNFQQYSEKVTRVEVDKTLYLESAAILQRKLAQVDRPMCPNLLYLRVGEIENEGELEDTLAVVAGPTLRTYQSNKYVQQDHNIISGLKVISSRSTNVTQVIVTLVGIHSNFCPDYTIFKKLRRVHIHGVVQRLGWENLAACPTLETLKVNDDILGPAPSGSHRVQFTFPTLASLSIKSSVSAPLFLISEMQELRSLTFKIFTQGTYVLLLAHLQRTSPKLTNLHLETSSFFLDPFHDIGHCDLANMSGLRRLTLSSPLVGLRIDDEIVGRIGTSLPELKELRIDNVPTGMTACIHITKVTPRSLQYLSKACRHLTDLSISVADPIDFQSRMPFDSRDHLWELERLVFYHVGIREATFEGLAEWVASACPSVRHLDVTCLTLARLEKAGRDEIDGFVESVFKAQKTQATEGLQRKMNDVTLKTSNVGHQT
ncbi:hypothetical protein FRB97_001229 [Tulasnella sp. 331]|nr:hypothetical protein FRB97_001229 [Tulasnella sp. 331]